MSDSKDPLGLDKHTRQQYDYVQEYLRPLVGGIVIDASPAISDMNGDGKWLEVYITFTVKCSDGQRRYCSVNQDSEDNGPGWLDIFDLNLV